MKKNFTLFKTLLVAVGLCTGVSAWAKVGDVTTNANIDFSNAITGNNPYTIVGSVGSMTWTRQWTYAPAISTDGYLLFGNMDSGNSASGAIVELQNANIGTRDKVTVSFELAFSKVNGKHIGFQLLDANNNSLLQQWFDAYNGDFDDANPLNLLWTNMYRGSNTIIWDRRVYFEIVFDYAEKKVTTSTKCYLSGSDRARTDATAEAAWTTTTPIAKFVLQGNLNNADRPSALDNFKITTTTGDYTVAEANYKIKYVCGEDEIKDAETRTGAVSSSISLFSTDKANFTSGDKRYIYVSDDSENKTVLGDGTQVVTITFREAAKYNYTVTSSYNSNPLSFGYTGSVWEDQNSISIVYPRYQVYNTTSLVGKEPNGNDLSMSAIITEDGQTIDVAYTELPVVGDLYFFSEAENISGLNASYPSSLATRISNKGMATGTAGTLLNLPAGKYKVTIGLSGGAGNNFTVAVNAGENEIISGNCTANTIQLFTSEEFALNGSTDITFTNSVNNSSRGIDFVYVQKTGEYSSTLNLNGSGYASFSFPSAVVISGATAYWGEVAVAGDALNLNAISDGIIPANTGVILKGVANAEVTYTTTTTEVSYSNNALSATSASTEIPATGDIYVLKGNEFFPLDRDNSTAFAANKAYLSLAVGGGAKLRMVFGGEATGIESVKAADVTTGVIYNMNGQQVDASYKGIVIVNGKKYFNK